MSDCRVTKEEAIELLKAYMGNEYYTEKWQETCRMAIDALNGQAEPVRHREWIFKHNPIEDPKGYFIRIVCSECNLHTGQKSNYCPHCGAKMKGAKDE